MSRRGLSLVALLVSCAHAQEGPLEAPAPLPPAVPRGVTLGELCVPDALHACAPRSPSRWSPNIPVTRSFPWTAEPEIAVDSKGRLFVAAMTRDGDGEGTQGVAIFGSFDHGLSFEPLSSRSPAPGHSLGDTTVAVDSKDRVYWAWADYLEEVRGRIRSSILATVSRDGENFQADQRVNAEDPKNRFCDRPWLTADRNGSMLISWTNGPEHEAGAYVNHYARSVAGGPFGAQCSIGRARGAFEENQSDTVLAVARGGGLVSADLTFRDDFPGGFSVDAHREEDGGWTDAPVQVLDPPNSATALVNHPLVEADSEGNLTLLFRNGYTRLFKNGYKSEFKPGYSRQSPLYVCRSTDGLHWSAPVPLGAGTHGHKAALPWLTTDDRDRIHVLWLDDQGAGWVPTTAMSADGLIFTPPERIGDTPFVEGKENQQRWIGDFISIAARSGWRYAVWTDTRQGVSQVYFAKALARVL